MAESPPTKPTNKNFMVETVTDPQIALQFQILKTVPSTGIVNHSTALGHAERRNSLHSQSFEIAEAIDLVLLTFTRESESQTFQTFAAGLGALGGKAQHLRQRAM